jgi:outer membrane protein assembly factor BamB
MLLSRPATGKLLLPVFILLAIAIFTSCTKTIDKSSAKNIIAFYLSNPDGSALDTSKVDVSINGDSINILLPPGTGLNGLIPDIKITGVSISPLSGTPQNFSQPVTYTVTAQDGSSAIYYVTVGYQKARNMVFAGSSDKNFYALDALSGKLIWKYTSGGWFSYASPTSVNGIVYAGCTDNSVYAFDDATGEVVWKFTAGGAIEGAWRLHMAWFTLAAMTITCTRLMRGQAG